MDITEIDDISEEGFINYRPFENPTNVEYANFVTMLDQLM